MKELVNEKWLNSNFHFSKTKMFDGIKILFFYPSYRIHHFKSLTIVSNLLRSI